MWCHLPSNPNHLDSIRLPNTRHGFGPCRHRTYVILAHTLHLQWRSLWSVTRQLLQTRSWHSSQSSPRSKIRPSVFRQRAHSRCPRSWGRRVPFRLISSSSFFSFLEKGKGRTSGEMLRKVRVRWTWVEPESSPYPLLLSFPQLLVLLQHLQDHVSFMFQQKGEVQILLRLLHWSLS